MPAAAARLRMIQRAVPRSSASAPNAAVHASRSISSPVTARGVRHADAIGQHGRRRLDGASIISFTD